MYNDTKYATSVPPVIIEDLVENTIGGGVGGETIGVVGRTMDLECYTIGTPTPTVTWTKDNQVCDTITYWFEN